MIHYQQQKDMENLQSQSFSFCEIRTVPEVINAAFEFVRLNFKVMFRGMFLYIVPLLLVGQFLTELLHSNGSLVSQLRNWPNTSTMAPGILATGNVVLDVLLLVLGFLCSTVAIMLIQAYVFGFVRAYMNAGENRPELADVWGQTKDLFWRVFGTNIGLVIIFVGGLFVIGVSVFILPLLGGLLYIGMLIMIPILLTNYALYFPARFLEKNDFGESFARAKELIVGRWWPTFGLLALGFLFLLIVGFFTLLPDLIFGLLEGAGIIPEYALYDSTSVLNIVRSVILVLFSTVVQLFMVFPLFCVVAHYYNQVERQEGRALAEDVATIGATENDG